METGESTKPSMSWTFSFPGFRPTYKPWYEEWGGDRQRAASVLRTDQCPKGPKMNREPDVQRALCNSLPWKETLCDTSGTKSGFHHGYPGTAALPAVPLEQLQLDAVLPTLPACQFLSGTSQTHHTSRMWDLLPWGSDTMSHVLWAWPSHGCATLREYSSKPWGSLWKIPPLSYISFGVCACRYLTVYTSQSTCK